MSYVKAILSLVPNAVFDIEGDDYDKIKWHESNKEKLPSKSKADAEMVRLEQEFKTTQYQRDRALQYPSIQDQLDMIYWDKKNGTKKWEEVIDKVKTDHPKPN